MTGIEIFTGWLLIFFVNTAATMSPGPAFAITIRNAIAYDRRTGLITSIGLGVGVGVHVCLVLFGFATILSQSTALFSLVKYIGAAYLIYIGFKALRAKPYKNADNNIIKKIMQPSLSTLASFKCGLLTNLLNPKSVVFFTAVYAQFISPEAPWFVLVLYGMTSVLIEIIWFSGVSIILTNHRIKNRFLGISHWIERLCGGLLIALGVKLALSEA